MAARINELEAIIFNLANQLGELHRTSTARISALETTLTERGSAAPCGAGPRSRGLVDPKHLAPEKFGADKGPAWKSWEYSLRAFVGSVHPELAEAMKAVRHQTSAVTAEQLAALAGASHVSRRCWRGTTKIKTAWWYSGDEVE